MGTIVLGAWNVLVFGNHLCILKQKIIVRIPLDIFKSYSDFLLIFLDIFVNFPKNFYEILRKMW